MDFFVPLISDRCRNRGADHLSGARAGLLGGADRRQRARSPVYGRRGEVDNAHPQDRVLNRVAEHISDLSKPRFMDGTAEVVHGFSQPRVNIDTAVQIVFARSRDPRGDG